MTGSRRLEDIQAWQRARQLTRAVHEASSSGCFARDHALRDPIRRGAISIMANMAEGLGRSGDREFLQFLAIAKGSAHEVASHLHVALDQGYVTQEQFDEISLRTGEVGRMLGGLNEYLRESRMEGSRLRPSGADAD